MPRRAPIPGQVKASRGRQSPLVLLVAIGGVGLALLVGVVIGGRKAPPPTPAPVVAAFDTIPVIVPIEPVAAGTKGSEIRTRLVAFPRHQVPQGALTDLASFREARTVAALPANLPLFPENFTVGGGTGNPVIERIPPGMRAMTIKVDATSAVEGWARPGSVVDVLLVQRERTTVVAERVQVLSAERSVAANDGASATVPSTVTLLTTQEQTLAINTAIPLGKIAFALRSTRDDAPWQQTSFRAQELQGEAPLKPERDVVSGVVSVKVGNERRHFTLADGKWVATAEVPSGFLAIEGRK